MNHMFFVCSSSFVHPVPCWISTGTCVALISFDDSELKSKPKWNKRSAIRDERSAHSIARSDNRQCDE